MFPILCFYFINLIKDHLLSIIVKKYKPVTGFPLESVTPTTCCVTGFPLESREKSK